MGEGGSAGKEQDRQKAVFSLNDAFSSSRYFFIKTAPDSGDQTCLLILGLVWDIGVENILVLVSDISIEIHDIRDLSMRLIHIHKGTCSFLKSQHTHTHADTYIS